MDYDNYIKNLEDVVNIDSGSNYGEGIVKLMDFFKNLYSGWNIKVYPQNNNSNPVMVIKNRESEDIDFLFIGHIDTVFGNSETKRRPFTLEGGLARGPGVVDMKSGCLLIYEVVIDLKDSGKNICIVYNSDEEIGSSYSKDIIREEGKNAKYVFVFEPARANGNMVSERKGILSYNIDFIGKSAHSGVNPKDGINANIEASHWILELSKLQNLEKNNSVNVGVINGGIARNVVPAKCSIEFEVRSFDLNFFEVVREKVDALIKNPYVKDIKINIASSKEVLPLALNENTKKLIRIYDDIKKEMSIKSEWESTGGASDANILGDLNIAVVDGLGPVGGNMHSEDEYLEINSVKERYELTKRVIEKLM